MLIEIDFNSEEAFYLQLKNQIIMHIAKAELMPGESLPSVRDMAGQIGINMHTVNKAYSVLREEGYLELDRRRGAVISLNADRKRAVEELELQLMGAVARAFCRELTPEEIRLALDRVIGQFRFDLNGKEKASSGK